MRKKSLHVAIYEVGLDELVKDFHRHCQRNGEMRDKIIGIYGMGGSGRTTLAKYLFNRKRLEFSESTILFDVRESHARGCLTSLQSKLLIDLFPENLPSFSSIEEGANYIKLDLQKNVESKFLVVLDDVDNQNQLDALLPIDSLHPNSLVIVTTRDERLLKQAGIRVRYKMKEMSAEHSRELFCWHAFHKQSCEKGFDKLVDSFVEVSGGLPLALQLMGRHVSGRNMNYWKSILDKVAKGRLDRDIKDTLKISYDALEDEKQIFIDIACFFIGKDVRRAMSKWNASGWRAEHGLQTLKDKCLLEVHTCFEPEDNNVIYQPKFILRMHDLLRDLGREMADNKTSHPRRLWHPEDLCGISKIKGFQDILMGPERESFRCFSLIDDLQSDSDMKYFLESSKMSTDLQWLELHSNSSHRYIPDWIPLQNLHTLSLEGVSPARLWQRDDQVPLKLKELYCSFSYLHYKGSSQDMCMRELTELVCSFGLLKYLERLQLNFGSEILTWNCFLKSVRARLDAGIQNAGYSQF